jgi:hypothetical protein
MQEVTEDVLPVPCVSVACPGRPARLSAGKSPACSWRFAGGTGRYPAAGTPGDHHQPRRLTGPGHDRRKGHVPCPAIEPGPPGSQGRRGRLTSSPAPPRGKPGRAPAWPPSRHCAGVRGRCPRRRPSGEAGCPGKTGNASIRHGGPAIPVPRSPANRQAARRGSGTGAGAPTTARNTSRVPAVDLSLTWPRNSRSAANLTPPAPGSPGSRPALGRCPPGPGHWQVHERSAPGRRKVHGRAARGRSQVHARSMRAGCMGFRTHPLPVTRSPSCVMTPGPAARPPGQEPAS